MTGTGEVVACQGLYHRKYELVYGDKTAGATTSLSLWTSSRSADEEPLLSSIKCECCTEYRCWKENHRDAAKELQRLADTPCYYKVCADEQVHVGPHTYVGTIRALHLAPEGTCNGKASTVGEHPYICMACEALQHGRDSQLLHKLRRATKLKHPRTDPCRASFRGVVHKYCSKENIQSALFRRKCQIKSQSKSLTLENKKILRDSWREHETARPFVEQLLRLFADNTLSEFDLNFLENWLGKKVGGKYWHATEQARMLSILLSNRLGEKMYSTIAPMMELPAARQAKRLREKDLYGSTYMPSLNDWAFSKGAEHCTPYQNSMDGTRVVRAIELYDDKYLVGDSFSPDIRAWPKECKLPVARSWEQVREYVLSVRRRGQYAAKAYSFDLVDTSGKLPDLLTGSIPESTSGVTASHVYSIMLEVEKKAIQHNL